MNADLEYEYIKRKEDEKRAVKWLVLSSPGDGSEESNALANRYARDELLRRCFEFCKDPSRFEHVVAGILAMRYSLDAKHLSVELDKYISQEVASFKSDYNKSLRDSSDTTKAEEDDDKDSLKRFGLALLMFASSVTLIAFGVYNNNFLWISLILGIPFGLISALSVLGYTLYYTDEKLKMGLGPMIGWMFAIGTVLYLLKH